MLSTIAFLVVVLAFLAFPAAAIWLNYLKHSYLAAEQQRVEGGLSPRMVVVTHSEA